MILAFHSPKTRCDGLIRRLSTPVLFVGALFAGAFFANTAAAQTAATSDTGATAPMADETVRMSAFEVRTTQGQGYSAGNSASALKTSESLMDLPSQILVVTSDMIHDANSHVASDILEFAGVEPSYRGPAIYLRGFSVSPYIDDAPQSTGIGTSDNTNIDSYQVIKGPEEVIYPLAAVGGVVLEVTKKPLPNVTQYIVDETVEEWGKQTFTFDVNQPIGKLGEVVLTARVEGIVQTGQGPFYNVHDDKWAIYPNIELDWKQTTLVLEYDALVQQYLPGGTAMITPSGNLYTGYGRREMGAPPHDYDHFETHEVRLEWTQRLSDSWQVKSQGNFFNGARGASSAGFPSTVNWNTNQVTYTVRLDNGWQAADLVQSDLLGKYSIGPIPMTSAFGFNIQDQVGYSKFYTAPTVTIPIGSVAAINSITFPPNYTYQFPGGNPGSRTETTVSNAYALQTIDVIPRWVTLSAGFTFSKIETVTDTNISTHSPYASSDQDGWELLHRLAALVHIYRNLTAYVMTGTTFKPTTGTDYNNIPFANPLSTGNEVGLKASFLDGKISASAAAFRISQTNSLALVPYPALNIAGLNYYTLVGTTIARGWDGSWSFTLVPGLQLIGTASVETNRDPNNVNLAAIGNSWTVFGRYDFPRDSIAHGLGFGGGAYRDGNRLINVGGLVLPGNAPLPVNASGSSYFHLNQQLLLNIFADYKFNKHWYARIACENVTNAAFALGGQGVGLLDPVDPTTISFEGSFKW